MFSNERSAYSIRRKLLFWLLIPLFGLCALSTYVAYRLAEQFANESYDKLLMRSADSIAARLSRNENGVVVADLPLAAQAILRHDAKDQFYYQIADRYGRRLTGDSVLPLPSFAAPSDPKFRYAQIDGQTVRMYRIAVQVLPSPDEIWVQVAERLENRQRFLESIFLSIIAPQVVLIVLASLSVWLGVKNGLAPLERLADMLKARHKLDLSPVDIGETPKELYPVTRALNDLFQGANDHIMLQRQFIGNAAHQLRTPVTALKTNCEFALRIKDSDSVALTTVLEQTCEAANRMGHMINRLMSLARIEEDSHKTLEMVDLTTAVNEAALGVVNEALRKNIDMEFDMPEAPVLVLADRGDLTEMVSNLLDNAIKYTQEKGLVRVLVEKQEAVSIVFEDNGPGITDVEKPKIFERFYRIPGTDVPGCGLGLSIVGQIAGNNGAEVAVLDRPGGGARFRVTFPRSIQAC